MKTDMDLLQHEIKFVAVRSRGPGGQNVNKVSSAAILIWDFENSTVFDGEQRALLRTKLEKLINSDGQISLRSDAFRDLPKNKESCLRKLENQIEFAFHIPKERHATRPTHGSKVRKRQTKIKRSDLKKSRQKVF